MERLLSYGLDRVLNGLSMCDDFLSCIKECVGKGGGKEECMDNCNVDLVTEYGLSLGTEVSDECSCLLGVDFEKIIDNIVKEIRGEIP